ncbi:hypothetical protein BH09PAT1_BH09PAT1_5470 [soil metagenome]
MEEKSSSSLMHDFTGSSSKKKSKPNDGSSMKYIGIFIIVILLGVGTGYAIASMKGTTARKAAGAPTYSVGTGKTFGVTDTKDFPDIAQGSLKVGGIEGEGAFHLVRPGGDDQTVYMTSSTVDLSQFDGKDVKVWGKTQAAQHAGWLMDVGKVQVL